MSSPWDFNKLFSPTASEASGVGLPAINTPELKPNLNPLPNVESWQKLALQSAGLIPAIAITDKLLKRYSPVSGWQQTSFNQTNTMVQPQNTFKFAIQEQTPTEPPPETNQWLAPPPLQETGVLADKKTSTKNLINLYKASAPKAKQGDGKLIVGGMGNFSSIEKGGTGGLFPSEKTEE